MINLNINDVVRVRLTPYGQAQLDIYYSAFSQKPKTVDGFYECYLWALMAIFGPMMHLGMNEVPFVDNRIEVIG